MYRATKLLIIMFFFCQVALVGQNAQADPVAASPPDQADELNLSNLGQALSESSLAGHDGRQDTQIDQLNVQISDMKSNANLSGNSLSALNSTINTGLNSISQDAFSNASGIVTVIQNSGNQVLIQNDMILNLWVK